MPDVLRSFLDRCQRNPAAVCPVKLAWRAFNGSLPPGIRGAWSRDRFVVEIVKAGFAVADLESVAHVAGLQLPGGAWRSEDGRLVFGEVAA